MDNPNPVPGGSGRAGQVVQQQVVVDPAAQNAAAQLAQQILANTNVTLRQEIVKIPEYYGEKLKDTVSAENLSIGLMNAKFQTTGTTPRPTQISGFACKVKQKNGFPPRCDI